MLSSGNSTTMSSGNATPSQLRSSLAGLWSSVLSSSSGSLPNHGIPVASTYDKLLEKHHNTLLQMKLSDPDLQETISRGFKRFQSKMRDSRAQTNASLQNIGIPYMLSELHDDIRYENAQAKVIQKQQEKTLVSPEARKFRIAQELAEARIKAQQALQLNNSNSRTRSDDDDDENTGDEASLASSSSSDNEETETADYPPSSRMASYNSSQSPTSVVITDGSSGDGGYASSSFIHLTPQQKYSVKHVVEDEETDDEDIQEVVEEPNH
jgi:hypothetical protein